MVAITAKAGDITAVSADAIVVNLFQGVTAPGGGTGAVDQALDGAISALISDGETTGKKGEITLLHTFGKLPAKRVVALGLGKAEKLDLDIVREVSATAGRYLQRIGVKKAATLAHGAGIGGLDPADAAQAIAEGTLLGLYSFKEYKAKNNDEPDKELEQLDVVEYDGRKVDALQAGITKGQVLSEGVAIARDLVNHPANVVNPARMAEAATDVAKRNGLKIEVLGQKEMAKLKMGSLLGVSQGSVNEPKLIVMQYAGDPGNPDNNIALVGKGITFDTGGISIKPAASMWEMKGDMSGGASV
ncbi:MAG: M17 family peptidase N-terminal domain-containing protein, partial [Dehalococcoidia bacterium]